MLNVLRYRQSYRRHSPQRSFTMPIPNLPPNQQLVRGKRWPLVGERHPRQDDSPWSVQVSGLATARTVMLTELQAMPQVTRTIDVHCVTRWSRLEMEFRGIRLAQLIGTLSNPTWRDEARYISFGARSARNHSTSLPIAEVLKLDPLIALEADGEPLTSEHGGPVRMVVPGKYFYKSVKWLERIEFLAEDRLGYWEADAGYHNVADPWREERYMAPSLSKKEAAELITDRDFQGRDLRSLIAADRDLAGLRAAGALLRNADFRRANLQRADFSGANLSNAHFHDADLSGANFQKADLEGVNLSGANLAAADLTGVSLFGASFCDLDANGQPCNGAKFDENTRLEESSLAALTEDQRSFVQSATSLFP